MSIIMSTISHGLVAFANLGRLYTVLYRYYQVTTNVAHENNSLVAICSTSNVQCL